MGDTKRRVPLEDAFGAVPLFTVEDVQEVKKVLRAHEALGEEKGWLVAFCEVVGPEEPKESEKPEETGSKVIEKLGSISRPSFLLANGDIPKAQRVELELFDRDLRRIAVTFPTRYLDDEVVLEELEEDDLSPEDIGQFLVLFRRLFTALYSLEQSGFEFPHLKIAVNALSPPLREFHRQPRAADADSQNHIGEDLLTSVRQVTVVLPELAVSSARISQRQSRSRRPTSVDN